MGAARTDWKQIRREEAEHPLNELQVSITCVPSGAARNTLMHVAFRSDIVPSDAPPPSPQDAEEMLGHYLAMRLPGKDNEAYPGQSSRYVNRSKMLPLRRSNVGMAR